MTRKVTTETWAMFVSFVAGIAMMGMIAWVVEVMR